MGRFHVGTSGWRYVAWRGDFYPQGLRQADELNHLSHRMNSVEINGSFYSLQTPQRYAAWRHATADGFTFAVKGGRFITHMKRLQDPAPGLANFFASGPLALEEKLGPFLWQLPENLAFDEALLTAFLERLPRDRAQADDLARTSSRDPFLSGATGPLRHALEPRHPSFTDSRCLDLLRRHDVALVCADTAGRFPQFTAVTADFVYVRLHGPHRLYFGSYRPGLIDQWAERIRSMAGERDAYVFFDNDADGAAPWDAIAMAQILSE